MSDTAIDARAVEPDSHAILESLIAAARREGADAADALTLSSRSLTVSRRMGEIEDLNRSETDAFGLRLLIDGRQAAVALTDAAPEAIREAAARAVAMARAAPRDPCAGLADSAGLADPRTLPDLDLNDPAPLAEDDLDALARRAEDAARAVDGVTNSGGAEASWQRTRIGLATSDGFLSDYEGTTTSLSVAVLAGEGTAMVRDYAMSHARHAADLEDAETVGRRAGDRTVARLGGGRIPTGAMPVVFEPRTARSLLGHFAQAINGGGVARGTSFLKHSMGERIFAPGVAIIDDARVLRGPGSRPFDGEGVATGRIDLVDDGALKSWLLDSYTARKLGLATTGSAARGLSSPPSPAPSNLWMAAGTVSPDALIGEIERGFLVTELIGMGVNPVTGDYSRGAAGFLIENGEIRQPVSEITIAGNLRDMFRRLTPADDLVLRYGMDAPTVRVEGMTIAGA